MTANSPPRLSTVFLNYNRLADTRQTLEHLLALRAERPQDDVEIIAIDNASGDGTADYLHAQGDAVTVICMAENTGIAGYNEGFRQARGDICGSNTATKTVNFILIPKAAAWRGSSAQVVSWT